MKISILLLLFVSPSTFSMARITPTRLSYLPMDVLRQIGTFVGTYTSPQYPHPVVGDDGYGPKVIYLNVAWNKEEDGYLVDVIIKSTGQCEMNPSYVRAAFDRESTPQFAQKLRQFTIDRQRATPS